MWFFVGIAKHRERWFTFYVYSQYLIFFKEFGVSKPSLKQVIQSVLAAAIGVQSKANRQRDFEHGSLSSYLIVGAIATLLFVLTLVAIISLIV